MPFPPVEPAPGMRGLEIYSTDVPTQKMVTFVTVLGKISMMANKEMLTRVGQAMIDAAAKMPSSKDLS
jgi:hypothetical protein